MFPSTAAVQADTLAHLALRAATQIDRRKRAAKADLSTVEEFAVALAAFAGLEDASDEGYALLDPISTDMLSMAASTTLDREIDNTDFLKSELQSWITTLRSISCGKDSDLDAAKRFCLSIYDYVSRFTPNRVWSRRDKLKNEPMLRRHATPSAR